MAGKFQRDLSLCDADYEGGAGGFDNIFGNYRRVINAQDAIDLHEPAMKQAEVSTRDARDCRGGSTVSEISLIQGEAESPPVACQDERQFVI
jgi:hypothetical protein